MLDLSGYKFLICGAAMASRLEVNVMGDAKPVGEALGSGSGKRGLRRQHGQTEEGPLSIRRDDQNRDDQDHDQRWIEPDKHIAHTFNS